MKLRSHVPDQLPPPGPDLDAIVHAKVMNLPLRRMCMGDRECLVVSAKAGRCLHLDQGGVWGTCPCAKLETPPPYSTDDAAAMKVLDKMEADGWWSQYNRNSTTERVWAFWKLAPSNCVVNARAIHDNFAAAICYAGIDAARIMKGESHDA